MPEFIKLAVVLVMNVGMAVDEKERLVEEPAWTGEDWAASWVGCWICPCPLGWSAGGVFKY